MIAVTGIGAVTGFGAGVPALWDGAWSGRSAIGACPYPEAGPAAALPGGPHEGTALGLLAAREALGDVDPRALGLVVGSTAGDMVVGEAAYLRVRKGAEPDADFVWGQRCDRPALRIARALGVGGPRLTVSNACSSGTAAVGVAADWIASGRVEAALVLGIDALCRLTVYGFQSLGLVASTPCRPFDRSIDGTSLGDGAGALLLESATHAARRGARPLAWVAGYGNAQDAHHMTAPHPDAVGLARAVAQALGDLPADDVGYVNAHGTGTPLNDASEAGFLARALSGAAVSSTKGAIGHTLGAAGALEAVITVLALSRGVLPPNAGLTDPIADLDFVREARPARVRHALSLSAAFGGNCAAIRLDAA